MHFTERFQKVLSTDKNRSILNKLISTTFMLTICLISSAISYSIYDRSLTQSLASYSEEVVKRTDIIVTETFEQFENAAIQQALATARIINSKPSGISEDYSRLTQVYSNLLNLENANGIIHSAYVYFNQGGLIVSSSIGIVPFKTFYDTEWLDIYRRNSTSTIWTDVRHPADDGVESALTRYGIDDTEVMTLLVPLSDSLRGEGGVIVINVYVNMLETLLNTSRENEVSLTALVNPDHTILLTGSPDDQRDIFYDALQQLPEPHEKSGSFSYMDPSRNSYICTYRDAQFRDCIILELVPITDFQSAKKTLLSGIILIYIILTVILVLYSLLMDRLSRKPIQELYDLIGTQIDSNEQHSISDINRIIQQTFQERDDLSRLWNDNKRIIRHRTLSLLLKGNLSTINNLSAVDIIFPYEYYLCCCIHMDIDENDIQPENTSQYEVLKMQLFSMIKDSLPKTFVGYTVDSDVFEITIIINKNDEDMQNVMNYCEDLAKQLRAKISPYTVTVGVGSMFKDIANLSISYRHAVMTMRYALAHYKGYVMSYADISLDSDSPASNNLPDNNCIREALLAGDISDARNILHNWLAEASSAETDSARLHTRFLTEVQNLSNVMYDLGIRNDNDLRQMLDIASENETLEEYDQFFLDLCNFAEEKLNSRRDGKNAKTMKKVLNFIDENYYKDISLVDAANEVFLSAPYLSKLFKDFTGETFIDHLTCVRIEHAQKLLLESDKKIKDIAEATGYTNSQSFIRAFKKVTGTTPKAYRDEVRTY